MSNYDIRAGVPGITRSWYTRSDFPSQTFYHSDSYLLHNPAPYKRTTNDDPNWRVKVAKGINAGQYYYTRRIYHYNALTRHATSAGKVGLYGHTYRAECHDAPFFDPCTTMSSYNTDPASYNFVVSSIKRKLATHNDRFQAIAPVAEIGELRSAIRGVARSSVQLLLDLLLLKKTKDVRTVAKDASELWLSFQFGVAPTVRDVNSAIDSIRNYLERSDHSVRFSSSSKPVRRLEGRSNQTIGLFGSDFWYSIQNVHEVSYRCIAGFDVFPKSANGYSLSEQFGLSFPDMVSAAWELAPFSWVVDYFANVGHLLEDRFFDASASTKYVTVDRRYNLQSHISGDFRNLPGYGSLGLTQRVHAGSLKLYEFERTVLSNLPRTQLEFYSFDEISRSWVNKALNLAAILLK